MRSRCSEFYNTVVLPLGGVEGTWAVYLLAVSPEAGKMVVGGHAGVLVREGGFEVVESRALSKGCLTVEISPSKAGQPIAAVVTHLLDDHPIETHAFLSLLHNVQILVMTETALWSVEGGNSDSSWMARTSRPISNGPGLRVPPRRTEISTRDR